MKGAAPMKEAVSESGLAASSGSRLARAREVFNVEISGLEAVRDRLSGSFEQMVELCLATLAAGGKLVITGIGKSGYIGKKIAATLSSTGAPAVFLHPVEALHGDLGIIQSRDLMLALSYSGETDELIGMLKPARRFGLKIIGITGNANSSLARISDHVVEMAVPQEACPFNLAPTTTTTALLALGDALAMVILQERGFTRDDFGRLHPGGAIGRMVTLKVGDIMRSGDRSAIVRPDRKVREVLFEMSKARCGAAIVVDGERKLLGIFTDGDFRRRAEQDIAVLDRTMREVMTPNPVAVNVKALAVEVPKVIEERRISDVIVVDDERRVMGLIDVQDLPGLKLM